MTLDRPQPYVFDLSGGELTLDFVNTVSGMRGVRPTDHLNGYEDLLAWGRQTGVLASGHADRLAKKARAAPADAAKALDRAKDLREALYRIWSARSHRRRPLEEDLEIVSAHARRAYSKLTLVDRGDCDCTLAWAEEDDLEAPLWPVAKDAVELLTGERAERVRQCEASEAGECSWLFLDETKNRSRRWCSMKDCGNRAKARRHYERAKGARKKAAT